MIHQRSAAVIENPRVAERTYRIRLECPEIARTIRPGQFVMIRPNGGVDPLLGRPFALYDVYLDSSGQPAGLDVVYLVVGKGTTCLSQLGEGDRVEVWGPLGNGFPVFDQESQVTLVAGGIGQTPFLAYARELFGGQGYGGQAPRRSADRVVLYYGVRNVGFAAGTGDFQSAGCEVRLATDDGSAGTRGYVTQLLAGDRPTGPIIGCGPEPMLKVLAKLTAAWGNPTWVSLETPMACGFGVCFSCVVRTHCTTGWDYRRVCVDGPVFPAATIDWNHS